MDESGVSAPPVRRFGLEARPHAEIAFHAGRLYTSTGAILEPTGQGASFFPQPAGREPNRVWVPLDSLGLIDPTVGRAYFLLENPEAPSTGVLGAVPFVPTAARVASAPARLVIFDQHRRVALAALDLPHVTSRVTRIVRWGADGLAFLTADRLILVRSAAIAGSP